MPGSAAQNYPQTHPKQATSFEPSTDREQRSRWYRFAVRAGIPLGVSAALHIGLVLLLSLKAWDAWTPREPEVGPYQATLVEQRQPSDQQKLRWDEPVSDIAETMTISSSGRIDFSADAVSLLKDLPQAYPAEGFQPGGAGVAPLGQGELAFGAGALSLLGTGSGAAAPGSGGLGDGLNRSGRFFDATLWDVRVPAQRVVYVVDFSGSIIVAVDELKRELKRSIGRLRPEQSFNVIIFYSEGTGSQERFKTEAFSPQLQPATESVRREFFKWLSLKVPRGETEPLPAIQRALALRPDVIFFFSDGYFDDAVVEEITRANRGSQTSITCLVFDEILLQDGSSFPRETGGARRMRRLAEQNRGGVKIVTGADLQR
jgi:hypothetical protein